MIKDIIVVIVLIFILIAIIKLQIFLSKKDNKLFGLIIPIFIFTSSLLLAFGGTPIKSEIETTQIITTETGQTIEDPLDTKTSTSLVDKPIAINSFIYTILIVNIGNFVMLGIYFHYRHQKKIQVELKRMKGQELF